MVEDKNLFIFNINPKFNKNRFYRSSDSTYILSLFRRNTIKLYPLSAPSYFVINHNFELYFRPQKDHLFIKRKFGVFKASNVQNKVIKSQLIHLSNFIKNRKPRNYSSSLNKRTKIIFSKKLNKLFFRAGRRLLVSNFNIKKNYTQTFLSKRIFSVLKNDWTRRPDPHQLINLILHTNLFYTYKDTISFINNTGILINKNFIYDPLYKINSTLIFSCCFYRPILNFFCKQRKKIIFSLKNIKFYKFRSKIFISKFKGKWGPSSEWIKEHFVLYIYINSNIEFDLRLLTGVFIYKPHPRQFSTIFTHSNNSLFMSRSYNWKYIT